MKPIEKYKEHQLEKYCGGGPKELQELKTQAFLNGWEARKIEVIYLVSYLKLMYAANPHPDIMQTVSDIIDKYDSEIL